MVTMLKNGCHVPKKLAQVINSSFTIFLSDLIIPERSEGDFTSNFNK